MALRYIYNCVSVYWSQFPVCLTACVISNHSTGKNHFIHIRCGVKIHSAKETKKQKEQVYSGALYGG